MKSAVSSVTPKKITVIILAVGSPPLVDDATPYPIFLSEIDQNSVLEIIAARIAKIKNSQEHYVFLESQATRFHLSQIASLLSPSCVITKISDETKGSGCTALLGACKVDPESELLFISANELVDVDFNEMLDDFRKRDLDGGTLIFKSLHPRYSFVSLDEKNFVTYAAQREPISSNATAGIFWFKKAGDFVEAIKQLILKDIHVDGSFFIAPTFNELILRHKRVGVMPLKKDAYVPLKTEQQVIEFANKRAI